MSGWELRVYQGVDPASARQRWATKTVRGSARQARLDLAAFVEETERSRIHAGTVADLLARWMHAASPHWAVTTVRQTRSVVSHHLVPHLGHVLVSELTTARIDAIYGDLLRCGGRDGRPLAPGTVHRVHVVLH